MLWNANAEELSSIVHAISASVAVLGCGGKEAHQILACNDRFRDMLGLNDGNGAGQHFRDVVPRYAWPDFEKNLEDTTASRIPLEIEQAYDIDRKTRWWRINAQPILNDSGDVVRILLTCLNITQRMNLERELATVNSRFTAVVESAYDGVVTVDQRENIKLFNKAAQEMFGYRLDDILGKKLTTLIPERYHPHHGEYVDKFAVSPIMGRQMFERGDITGIRKDGSEFPVEISIAKITVNGLVEFTAVIRDVSERARMMDELRVRATTDALTGLNNRRMFQERSVDIVALANRHDHPLSTIMLDIDKFKTINDTYGHAEGDRVLKAIAAACRKVSRESDVVARMGGEEFAILLPITSGDEAVELAERLRVAIAENQYDHDWDGGEPIAFTISAGIGVWDPADKKIDDVLNRADKALYSAKEGGRNRVERQAVD
jgi:diguanylate cyclase (GGDEF)-like protein/PAS domain S-box-containing protein